jgi:hypothetical protein
MMGDTTKTIDPPTTRPRSGGGSPPPVVPQTRPRSGGNPPPRPQAPPKSALSPQQLEWIEALAKAAGKSAKADEKRGQQLALINSVGADLALSVDSIKAGQTYQIMEKNKGLFGDVLDAVGYQKLANSLDPGADPNQEFDTGSVNLNDYEGLSPAMLKRVMEAQHEVVKLADRLRNATEDGGTITHTADGKKRPEGDEPELMFDADEIDAVVAAEIWQPLVRQRAIPENAVPDRYSEVKQTFDGASQEYQKRLADYTKKAPKRDGVLRGEALLKTIVEGTNVVGSNVLAIVKDHIPGADAAAAMMEVAQIMELVADLETVAFGITEAALKEEFDPQILVNCLGAITQGLALDKPSNEDQQTEIAAIKFGCSAALQSGAFVAYLAKGQPDKAMIVFGDMLNTAISAQETSSSGSTFSDIGADVQSGVATLVNAAQAAWKAKDGKYAEALDSLCTGIATMTTNFVDQKLAADITNKDDSTRDKSTESFAEGQKLDSQRDQEISAAEAAYNSMIDSATSSPSLVLALVTTDAALAKQLEAADQSGKFAEVKANWAKLTEKQKAGIIRMQRGVAESEAAASKKEAEEARKNFAALTASEEPSDIDRLIAEVKLQEARFTLAVKLSALPFQAIGALFPPAKMGACVINLANEMRLAAECGMQFLEWADNVADGKRAGSVQAEAMTSRMDLSQVQAVRHGVQAALLVVQIIGQGVTLAGGPAAHVGLALDKGAGAAMAAKSVATAIVDYRKAAKAWRIYQKALDRPESRLTARKALRVNPTLAKYAIAYGAKQGNPIAANALRKCGITEAMLADEEAGVSKLVTFMEAKFSEDPIVLRRVPIADWYPGTSAVTAASWMEFVTAAEENADPKLAKLDPVGAAAALSLMETAQAEYDRAGDDLTETLVGTLLERLLMVRRQLMAIKPLDTKGNKHETFVAYLKAMVATVEERIAVADKMKGIVASTKKMFDHVHESFAPLEMEVMALMPAPGSALATRKFTFIGRATELADLVSAQDWPAALTAVKEIKTEANEILDANSDLEAAFRDSFKLSLPVLEQAKAVPETDAIRARLGELAALRVSLAKSRQELDWEIALDLLDQATDLARDIIAAATP